MSRISSFKHADETGLLHGKKVAFIAADGVQQEELEVPWNAIRAAGGIPELISINSGEITSTINGEHGKKFKVDKVIDDIKQVDFSALVIPGGLKSPDTMRMNANVVALVRSFVDHYKPVAAICHGPWLLVDADVLKGRRLTSYPSLKKDIENAGGEWADRAVIVEDRIITSRTPQDLPQFCDALIVQIADSIEERALDKAVEQSFPASDPLPGP